MQTFDLLNHTVLILVFRSFEFVSDFACLREAASAKAGISCFEFRIYLHSLWDDSGAISRLFG
jgi:hypothetical protein